MLILKTKLKNIFQGLDYTFNLKNIDINGSKRGCSGFITNNKNNKVCYITTEASEASWLKPVMIRTAKNIKDYTGGINNFIDTIDIVKKVTSLLSDQI